MPLPQLRRVRWAVRASLVLGVAASVSANVLHAQPNPVAQTIAAWPPLALLLAVELISRVPVHRRSLATVRLLATAAIAAIAAWVSYWHMMAVAARYGESGSVPYLLPLSVDGLVIVASVSLVELAGRIRAAEAPAVAARVPAPRRSATSATAGTSAAAATVATAGQRADGMPARAGTRPTNGRPAKAATNGKPRRPAAETRRLAEELAAEQPEASDDDVARQLGITTKRLRSVLAAARV